MPAFSATPHIISLLEEALLPLIPIALEKEEGQYPAYKGKRWGQPLKAEIYEGDDPNEALGRRTGLKNAPVRVKGARRCADKLKDKKLTKQKRKLTPAEKAQKKKRQMEYMTIFIKGKQKRVKRPPTIDGIDLDIFIQRNADAIWLHQNEMWEDIDSEGPEEIDGGKSLDSKEGIFFNRNESFV